MNIKIKNKNGITLKTEGKYCKEDINVLVDESILGGGGSGETGGSGLGTEYGAYLILKSSHFDASDITIDVSNAKIVNPDNVPIYYNEISINIKTYEVTTGDIKLFEGDINSIPLTMSYGSTHTFEGYHDVASGMIMNGDNSMDDAAGIMISNVYYVKFEDLIDKTAPKLQISIRPRDGVDNGWLKTDHDISYRNTEGTKMYAPLRSGSVGHTTITTEQTIDIPFHGDFVFVAR